MTSKCMFRCACVAVSLLGSFAACVGDSTSAAPAEGAPSPLAAASGPRVAAASGGGAAIELSGSAVALETVAVQRGAVALDVTVLADDRSAPGTVAIVRGDFVETVEALATQAGQPAGSTYLEQSWQFSQAPGAAGDLVITVATTGLDYLGTTADGLALRHAGQLDVRYSHGTWLDASGAQWAIPAHHDSGHIVLTVPAAVVAASRFPAVLDPQIVVTPIT